MYFEHFKHELKNSTKTKKIRENNEILKQWDVKVV